ncbi:SAM-dependent methyltransferase [Burkholderiales bacterium]|nr:SAM-dependent methyltransferase [Burkholderiales bacterium]
MTEDLSDQAAILVMFKTYLAEKNNWLDFASFMHHALFDPQYGYYMRDTYKFGSRGDFITAPEVSDLFGRTIARQCAQILQMSGGSILELGGGSGVLGSDILLELDRMDCSLDEYLLFEPSAALTERQKERIGRLTPNIKSKVRWVSEFPKNFNGIILANEVFDALPVHLLSLNADGWQERGVALDNESLTWQDRPIQDERLHHVIDGLDVNTPYVTEVCLAADSLINELSQSLNSGAILAFDYGYEHCNYYHPDRRDGTLSCHYQHKVDSDPLERPGHKDITAHVDFSRLAHAAHDVGLEVAGYVGQADFLVNCGITDLLASFDPDQLDTYLPVASAAQKLLSPTTMGEMFKVISFTRGINEPLFGFSHRDRLHML